MAKVTILIAVYNAEKYLEECLDSLLAQTMSDFQAVCVDDASTDSSWSILEQYASRDGRIEILRLQENHGQAYARNVALGFAHGEYTCFLDSDDKLSSDALEKAVGVFDTFPATDCVLFKLIYCLENGSLQGEYDMSAFDVKTGYEAFRDSLNWDIHGVYIIRTSIHKECPYDDSSINYSDDNTTRVHYLKSREVRLCEGVYYYRQHGDSVTHRISLRRYDYLRANTNMKKQLQNLNVPDDILSIYENVRWLNCIGMYMFYYQNRSSFSKSENAYGLQEIKNVWADIDVSKLEPCNNLKFGYYPFKKSWWLFRLQEELYFFLRTIKNGLNK